MFGPNDWLDTILDPADIIQVMDADASQTKVIEEVRRGANLVVQGPPGTGKSQTITNLIAVATHDGKSVLFIAEKMAALSVVHDRLVKTGLRDICLQLHSRSAHKKALAQELGRTLRASLRVLPGTASVDPLRDTPNALNGISDVLHMPIAGGESPFGALAEITRLIGDGTPPPRIPLDGLHRPGPTQRKQVQGNIADFVVAREAAGEEAEHTFNGVAILNLQPTDLTRLSQELEAAIASMQILLSQSGEISGLLGQLPPNSLDQTLALVGATAALAGVPATAMDYVAPLFDRTDKPKRKPIPDHILRVEVELTPGNTACAQCGGKLRRLGEAEEDQETVRGTVSPTTDRRAGIGSGPLAIVLEPMADNGSTS